jgi:murein DD-endopeptidase MepM/ murein hydrolase activator NlpD
MKTLTIVFRSLIMFVILFIPTLLASAAPNPNRPENPPGRPVLQLPFVEPVGQEVQVWCGPGCGAHQDRQGSRIQTHFDIDYGSPGGGGGLPFPVVASAGGRITRFLDTGILRGRAQEGCHEDIDPNTEDSQGLGAFIDHGNGWSTFYFHLSEVNIHDPPIVEAGDVIGTAGCTGANSIHLHYDLRWRDPTEMIDPTGTTWTFQPGFVQPPEGVSVDLAFVIDTTASMSNDIEKVKEIASDIVDIIKEEAADSRIAVVEFRDFPDRTGTPADFPYQDVQTFTFDSTKAKAAIASLGLGDGGDGPESRNCALMHVINGDRCAGRGEESSIGVWRPVDAKFIIVLSDAPALSPEPFTGFTTDNVIEEANKGDFISIEGDGDGGGNASRVMSVNQEFPGIAIYPVVIRDNAEAIADAQRLADGTGGNVFRAPTTEDIVNVIRDGLREILQPLVASDLSITKTDLLDPIVGESSLTYTLNVANCQV